MLSSPLSLGNASTNLSDLESGWAPFLTPLTEQTRHLERVHQVRDKDSHYSTSTLDEFLQDITIENTPIDEEEDIHPTRKSMIISGNIQYDRVLPELLLVATNESYFSKLTGRTEADVLADKVIVSNNLKGTPGMRQHNKDFSGATKALYLLLGSEKVFIDNSRTGGSETANETEYTYIKETFVGNTLKCKK